MLELLCETDFVAINEDFLKLGNNIVMHIASTAPKDAKELMKVCGFSMFNQKIKDEIDLMNNQEALAKVKDWCYQDELTNYCILLHNLARDLVIKKKDQQAQSIIELPKKMEKSGDIKKALKMLQEAYEAMKT